MDILDDEFDPDVAATEAESLPETGSSSTVATQDPFSVPAAIDAGVGTPVIVFGLGLVALLLSVGQRRAAKFRWPYDLAALCSIAIMLIGIFSSVPMSLPEVQRWPRTMAKLGPTDAPLREAIRSFGNFKTTARGPEEFWVGKAAPFTLTVTAPETQGGIVRSRATNVYSSRTVALGRYAEAQLYDPSGLATIVPRSEKRQLVSPELQTQWVWDVTAPRPGTSYFVMGVHSVAIVDGRETLVLAYTEEVPFRVKTTFWREVVYWVKTLDPVWKSIAGILSGIVAIYLWIRTNIWSRIRGLVMRRAGLSTQS